MIRLPHHLKTFDVFNVQHLTSYLEEEQNLRMKSLQPRKNDVVGLVITG
jgi:hypothetical protein